MNLAMRWCMLPAALLAACLLASCTAPTATQTTPAADAAEFVQMTEATGLEERTTRMTTQTTDATAPFSLDKIDMSAWHYNTDDNVYYQLGVPYCTDPADPNYECLAILVPGDYFSGENNKDGTYTCAINADAVVGGYTPATAPIVMPIDTPGYSAMRPMTEYQSQTLYTDAGFVYVRAGCRGRDSGAPAGVTDIKAAIRYLRYSTDAIPADTERFFVFGMSGGGAQSAILGASGNSPLYNRYLEHIGAVMNESDAVLGVMAWCPITNLDSADAAYEWMMGNTRTGLSDEERTISDALAARFAEYVSRAGFTDAAGNALRLEPSEDGVYQSGTYYEYLLSVIEDSLNTFLAETAFPYDASASAHRIRDDFGGFGGLPEGMRLGWDVDDIQRTRAIGGVTLSGTYNTAREYIDALNADTPWVSYDPETNTASITSVADFTAALKNASKGLGAFDQLDRGQGENELFGQNGTSAHFDAALADILTEIGTHEAADYAADLKEVDELGMSVAQRLAMYTPLYYLLESEEGFGTSTVAKYWRIRTGISQGDTSLTTELNLVLALKSHEAVESIDFATVWGEKHTKAETSGDSNENFTHWVEECTR